MSHRNQLSKTPDTIWIMWFKGAMRRQSIFPYKKPSRRFYFRYPDSEHIIMAVKVLIYYFDSTTDEKKIHMELYFIQDSETTDNCSISEIDDLIFVLSWTTNTVFHFSDIFSANKLKNCLYDPFDSFCVLL